ncbi:hypothetical protein [Bremerella sp. P1]|uniref:hypothetical protein n=1 Tax=Bremerella sp. P1 TaxID=3026424 RepID=UPI0023683F4B|nr:hypothetical protein [Bremerella sp. P1]WDI44409.1 hypothetical protein PSR63_10740 [Bremerella sp. P1]
MKPLNEIIESIDSVVVKAYESKRIGDSVSDAADSASTLAGYQAIGDGWRTIEHEYESIIDMLAYDIGHDLAYSSDQLLPIEECVALAESLSMHAESGSTWVTNHSPKTYGHNGTVFGSWNPVSDWTFDKAIVAVGHHKTLFICFFAED